MGFKIVNPDQQHESTVSQITKTRKRRNTKGKYRKLKYGLLITGGVLLVAGASVGGMEAYNHAIVKTATAHAQKVGLRKKANIAPSNEIEAQSSKLDYGSNNHGIPDAKQLAEYQKLPEQVYGRGYIAVPKQHGVTQQIDSLVINEGASDKVLSLGAGTPRPGEVMGQGNFAVAAHNFGNNVTYFSPMQRNIDVNESPKAYLTDGKRIYVYQFNKTSDDVPGRKVVNYRQGEVLDDSAGKGKVILTLITCDEPGIFTLTPENRLLLRGYLISSEPVKQASASEKALFPQVFSN